jgi:glycosyltransferase involved in cell wall biosynthesis
MMSLPLISVVIPAYNAGRYLTESLQSVIAQTYRPIEIILIDDGSVDNTVSIASQFPGVKIVSQENSGPAAARNRGVSEAKGPLIAFQDADDVWDVKKLGHQAALFEQRPELELCTCQILNFWTPDRADEAAQYNDPRQGQVYSGFVMQTLLARRSALERVGPLRTEFRTGEDSDWFMRAKDLGAIMEIVPEVLVYRRLHPANLTRQAGQGVRHALVDAVHESLRRRRQKQADTQGTRSKTGTAQ